MTTPVPLYQPLNTLKAVADGIWIADGDITWMNMGILRAPFSTRMTVIRLQDGGLWCHSPIAPDAALFAAIDALGAVRHLVSPKLHSLRAHPRLADALPAGGRLGESRRARTRGEKPHCRAF